jgi:hypothetical protein
MDFLFNRSRWMIMVIPCLLLVLLGVLSWSMESRRYDEKLYKLQHPKQAAAELVCIGYIRIDQKTGKGVQGMDQSGTQYRFLIDPKDFVLGDRYSLKGRITADGSILVESYQHHPHRILKHAFSLLSLILVLYILRRYIRFDRSSWSLSVVAIDSGLFGIGGRKK